MVTRADFCYPEPLSNTKHRTMFEDSNTTELDKANLRHTMGVSQCQLTLLPTSARWINYGTSSFMVDRFETAL